jgi:hypothetical protein
MSQLTSSGGGVQKAGLVDAQARQKREVERRQAGKVQA